MSLIGSRRESHAGIQPGSSARERELIENFEAGITAADGFHHADHVRLAFAYLRQYDPLLALDRFSAALKQFARNQGKPGIYSETITYAYFFLIRERMARSQSLEWDRFARQNPDLLLPWNRVLDRYYQEATWKSDFARRVFVLPDKSVSTGGFS
jgi:hypothetical protein